MARRSSNSSKPFDQLSAQELYELAKQKEQEEQEAQREASRQRLEELRERRRDLLAQHKKEMGAIEREMAALGGRRGRGAGRPSGSGGGKVNLTDKVLEIIGKAGTINTKDLKVALEKEGMDTTNMGQTLAYLKRNGRVASPSRATYSLG